jgi:thioredoxin 1
VIACYRDTDFAKALFIRFQMLFRQRLTLLAGMQAPPGASALDDADAPTYVHATSVQQYGFPVPSEVFMSTVKVTDASWESDVLQSTEPVVVDFWAEWCGPCKMIGPSLEELAKDYAGKVKIVKLNVDENPGVAGKLGIRSIPTLMLFKDGKVASQKVGAAPKGELAKWINAAI